MPQPFAYELGLFDPTFPGITLHFPNEAAWSTLNEVSRLYFSLGGMDMLQKNPRLSEVDITPERVQEHIYASVENGIPLDAVQKERLGRAFIDRDPGNAVANLAVASVHEHERRHFHDWLLSPHAAAITAVRSEVFINHARLEPFLRSRDTTVLPVPLTRWLRKSSAEQAALIDMWQRLLGNAVHVQVPDLSNRDVRDAIEGIARRYRTIGSLFTPLGAPGLDEVALFEASALLIQTQAIHDLFGEAAGNHFVSTMASQGQATRYAWFLNAMSRHLRPGEVLENDTVSTIAVWCLLGNHMADEPNSHAVVRLTHAQRFLQQQGFPAPDAASRTILEALDAFVGCVPYDALLRHSVELGNDIVQQYHVQLADEAARSNRIAGILQAHEFLHACHAYMANTFLDDPDGYCKPTGYLDRKLENWPEPLVRHTFGRPFHSVKRADLERLSAPTVFERDSSDDTVFLRQYILPPHARVVIAPQLADNWQYLCAMADFVFAEFNRDQPAIEAQRDALRGRGIYAMEVLS